ncbi:MAG TPA: hypothetical protein QGF63_12000 [Alphaproteobacteria bacterium]|nr:hypothetical protein [Alphaproteobacteria bacterium]
MVRSEIGGSGAAVGASGRHRGQGIVGQFGRRHPAGEAQRDALDGLVLGPVAVGALVLGAEGGGQSSEIAAALGAAVGQHQLMGLAEVAQIGKAPDLYLVGAEALRRHGPAQTAQQRIVSGVQICLREAVETGAEKIVVPRWLLLFRSHLNSPIGRHSENHKPTKK